ncbi:MAG: hypothetical protein B6242_15690 [Anaerolineaceae bacterium 4572_78]|nr:MAG: hypothetical protein B6242_15690 [Anaerolineaceae bacterium 4572_78]
MDELSVTDLFLTWVITYGSPVFGVALFLGALGIPIPGTFFVLAAGAFIRQGALDGFTTSCLGLLGAITGDSFGYIMGRLASGWVQKQINHSPAWQSAAATFEKRGGIAIFLTRWLLTPLAVPTNLIAGGSGCSLWRFLGYDILGELTWILLYGGLGYTFGSQWELISEVISDFSGFIVGFVFLGIGIYLVQHNFKSNVVATT